MLRRTLQCLSVSFAIGAGCASHRSAPQAAVARAASTRAAPTTRPTLEDHPHIPVLDMDDVPLSHAMEAVRRATGVPIILDQPVLNNPNMGEFYADHLHLRDVSLPDAIDLLVSGKAPPLTWQLQPDGVIHINQHDAGFRTERVYDVRELTPFLQLPTLLPALTESQRLSGVGERYNWLQFHTQTPSETLLRLMQYMTSVAPGLTAIGPRLQICGGRLFASETDASHRRIARALAVLRQGLLHPRRSLFEESDKDILEKLDTTLAPISFNRTPLPQAVDILADRAGVNLAVNWNIITNVDRRDVVTEQFAAGSLRSDLSFVFADVRKEQREPVVFGVVDNILAVGTGDLPPWQRSIGVWDVRDVVADCARYRLSHQSRSVGIPKSPPADYTDEAEAELWRAIEFCVDFGNDSMLVAPRDRVVAIGPLDTLREIQQLLSGFREINHLSRSNRAARPMFLPDPQPAFEGLKVRIPEVLIDRLPFDQALGVLSAAAATTIYMDDSATATLILPQPLITLHLRDVPMHVALRQLCRLVSSHEPLDYRIRCGAIVVSTREQAVGLLTRVYDVRDLVEDTVRFRKSLGTKWNSVDGLYLQYGGFNGMNGCDYPPNSTDETTVELTTAMQQVFSNGEFPFNRISSEEFREFGGRLIIRDIPQFHLRVEEFLDALRSAKAEGTKIGSD